MLNENVRFCLECSKQIDNTVPPEILKHRKGMCITCFLKNKKKPDIEYCKHNNKCRYFSAEFCIVGDKEKGWYEYTVNPDGSNRCFREKITVNNKG